MAAQARYGKADDQAESRTANVDQNIANRGIAAWEEGLEPFAAGTNNTADGENNDELPAPGWNGLPEQNSEHREHGYMDALIG